MTRSDTVDDTENRLVGGAAIAAVFGVVLGAALFVGWVFSTIDTDSGFARWDQSVAGWGPSHAGSFAASLMKVVTYLGSSSVLVPTMTIVAIIDWRRRRNWTGAWFLATVGIGIVLINNALKRTIMRERPPVDRLVEAAGSSFPSGHSASAAACWLAIAFVVGWWVPRRLRPWLFAAAVAIACLVAASRTLLGVHWVTDVVAGLVVGWAWCGVVALVFFGRSRRVGAGSPPGRPPDD